MIYCGSLTENLHILGENLTLAQASVNQHIEQTSVHIRAVVRDSKMQLFIASSRVCVFRKVVSVHAPKVSHFVIAVKCFCKCLISK